MFGPEFAFEDSTLGNVGYLDLEPGKMLRVSDEIETMLEDGYGEVGAGDVAAHIKELDEPEWTKTA